MPHQNISRTVCRSIMVVATTAAIALMAAPVFACTIERVSVDDAGDAGNNRSEFPVVSADGRVVAFESIAGNLVPGDTNGVSDVFVHDRTTGLTERVSVDSAGHQATDLSGIGSTDASISADGRYVAFGSSAANLVAGDTNAATDVYVHDRVTGITERVSVNSQGQEANDGAGTPAISADGGSVAFISLSSNLVPGGPSDAIQVVVHDRLSGATERVSVDGSGNPGNADSERPSISADGRIVVFDSNASNLLADDTNRVGDVFVHDRLTGVTERVSVDSAGREGNGMSFDASISGDGRIVAFMTFASNLAPGPSGELGTTRVLVHDRLEGTTQQLALGTFPSVSADGRYVAFIAGDVFVYDRVTGSARFVSVDGAGNPGDGLSTSPSISADGRVVTFTSDATNLTPEGIHGFGDAFVAVDCLPPTCAGDCNHDGAITVDELLVGINLALDKEQIEHCPTFDANGDGAVTVEELLAGVDVALDGCNLSETNPVPYRLFSDSFIRTPGTASPPVIEGLTGTFVVIPTKPLPPNTLFDFTMKTLRLRSGAFFGTEYAVDGSVGRISATTLDPTMPLTTQLTVTINGESVELVGSGSADTFTSDPHPRFTGLTMSGGGYQVTISAVPEL